MRETAQAKETQTLPIDPYIGQLPRLEEAQRERVRKGRKLIKGKDIPWCQDKNAIVKRYIHPSMTDVSLDFFRLFVHEIRTHSGKHIHQGGLGLFVLRGKGYTVVDGVRHDWEEGDLIMLPIKGKGVEHQHFNTDSKPSRWVALIPGVMQVFVGNMRTQKEVHPDWHEPSVTEPQAGHKTLPRR